jgi:NADH dehydrogenase (ubiquinone) 1 alpha/beta subcomplex 1
MLPAFRNRARSAIVATAARLAPSSTVTASSRRAVVPHLWARSFSAGFIQKDEVLERVMSVVKNYQGVDKAKVAPTSHFMNDLGLDSLDVVEVLFFPAPSCFVPL